MSSAFCSRCILWFIDNRELEHHLDHATQHQFHCRPCNRDFVSRLAQLEHWQKNPSHKHTYCKACKQIFGTSDKLIEHYATAAAHKNTYDARCNSHFGTLEAKLQHKHATPERHHICLSCHFDFATGAALTEHCKNAHKGMEDGKHETSLPTSEPRLRCQNTSFEQNVCQHCRIDFATPNELLEHWRTSEVHMYTFDRFCLINFPNPQMLLSHMKENPHKHHMCLPCAFDYRSDEELREHLKTAEVHKDSFCSKCELDLGSASNLKLHARSHSPKPLTCLSCEDTKQYPSNSAFFAHLESGSCPSGWTIQRINALISVSLESNAHVIGERLPWFLAGPPRTVAQDSDRDQSRNIWRCPICTKEEYSSRECLSKHLKELSCYSRYPNVLKCSGCTSTFTKFCKLLQHVETDSCPANIVEGSIARLLAHMKRDISNPGMQHGVSGINYELCGDPAQPRKLIVKVASTPDLILFNT